MQVIDPVSLSSLPNVEELRTTFGEEAYTVLGELREQQATEYAQAVARVLTDYANGQHDGRPLAAALSRQHRTLQQATFGLLLQYVFELASLAPQHYDGRNAYSVELAQAMREALLAHGFCLHNGQVRMPCI